jgi:hypothetical protein
VVQHKPFKELHSKHLSVDLKKTKSFNFQRNLKLKQPKKKNCFSSKTLLFVTDDCDEEKLFLFWFYSNKKADYSSFSQQFTIWTKFVWTSSTLIFILRYLTKTKTAKLKIKKFLQKKKVKIMSMRKKKKAEFIRKFKMKIFTS